MRQEWQYRLELPKLCYHPWLAADEDRVSHVLSHVVWWIYIYIYIVIHRQTVSFYQKSSVWLDTQDARSRDRNPSNFTLDCDSDHSCCFLNVNLYMEVSFLNLWFHSLHVFSIFLNTLLKFLPCDFCNVTFALISLKSLVGIFNLDGEHVETVWNYIKGTLPYIYIYIYSHIIA